jgi:hypothetical protein
VEDEKAFIAALTELALERAAPEELVVFEETAEEYFADPQGALTAARQDSAVGFGLELAMVTPVALAVGGAVVQALMTALSDRAVTGISGLLRRVLRKRTPEPTDIVLSPEQARYVRQVALERARSLGMPEQQAALLADSFVGAMATAS